VFRFSLLVNAIRNSGSLNSFMADSLE